MSAYMAVTIQRMAEDAEGMVSVARSIAEGEPLTLQHMIDACEMLGAGELKLSCPTYLNRGEEVGDIVAVPYGKEWKPLGVVVRVMDKADADLVPGVTYKPASAVLMPASAWLGRE